MRRPTISIVGSANTDLTVLAADLPAPGETVLGGELVTAGGGKGANQAVAAARAGAAVTFVGRVGDDDFGRATLANLRADGIDTDHLTVDQSAASGVALIIVDGRGENLIAVAPGANGRVSPADVARAADSIAAADLLLLQLEVPLDAVRAAVEIAGQAGTPVLLNPAPAPPERTAAGLLAGVAYLTPNATEAAQLAGASPDAPVEETAQALVAHGLQAAVLTLGARGACLCDGAGCLRIAPPVVDVVDTVGAGDCFSGTFAVALAEGRSLEAAVRFAVCASALSVQKRGAQPSMPIRAEIDRLLDLTFGRA